MAGRALFIERPALEAMLARCREALPLEACGLLGGRDHIACSHYPIVNAAEEPQLRFEMAPAGLAQSLASMEERGEELVAVYHSHPRTSAVPSQADLRGCLYPEAHYVIVSYAGGRESVRAFRIHPARRAVESHWRAIDPPRAHRWRPGARPVGRRAREHG